MSAASDAVLGAALALVACAPQVVDAVDAVANGETAAGRGGSSGSSGVGVQVGGTGATGPTGASGGTGGISGGATGASGPSEGGGEAGAPVARGCDALGSGGPDKATCQALVDSLVHRYTFDGARTAVVDAWGGPSGKVVNSTLTGDGAVTLAGHMSDQYVDLPNGILSAMASVTLEMWLTWAGGSEWQRILDFGNDQKGVEGSQSSGDTYLFVTPRLPEDGQNLLRVAYQRGIGYSEVRLDATRTLPASRLTHVAVTYDSEAAVLAVYIDGTLENSKSASLNLVGLDDINNWLGRSQYAADPELNATIEEFRIYARALTATELEASFDAGPNPMFLADGPP